MRGASTEDRRTFRMSAGEDTPTLVSLGGARLLFAKRIPHVGIQLAGLGKPVRGALTSPCGTSVLQIAAVETRDCLGVSVFPLDLLVRVFGRKVDRVA